MGDFTVLVILCLFALRLCTTLEARPAQVFDVLNFGAVGDGQTDDSKAFLKAWKALIDTESATSVFEIPPNKLFLLRPLILQGPTKSKTVHVSVLGDIVAAKKSSWKEFKSAWLQINNVDGLIIDGTGKLNGRGETWWGCKTLWTLFINGCNDLQLRGLTFINSPRNHISLSSITRATLSNLHIIAPENSPNTDGLDISHSTQIQIQDSFISTGDDCIAINGGSSFINITNVACGPGHGISVGSLGEKGSTETVEEIHVTSCNFTRTQNGVRIKTWQGGSGYARKISFKDIKLVAVDNPVIIDQTYCPSKRCNPKSRDVQVSHVSYIGVHGSSTQPAAIILNCSKKVPCTRILIKGVNIVSLNPGEETYATCNSAHGNYYSTLPNVSCLA
ncbi:galacturonan 1,4-alpha-galacturonidase [Ranunculus cassubicifolius]